MKNYQAALLQFFSIWSITGWSPKKFFARMGGKHRPFTDGSRRRLFYLLEYLPSIVSARDDLLISIQRNNAWGAAMEHTMTRSKGVINWMLIILLPPLILVFTGAAIITYVIYIKTNSMDGSVEAAAGLAISIWAASPALKYFMGGTLAPWKRPLEIVMVIAMLAAFAVAGWEITQHFFIFQELDGGLPDMGSFNPFETGAAALSSEPKVVSFSTLYFALSILEVIGVYALISAFANALSPRRTEEEKAVDKQNIELRVRERELTKQVAKVKSEIEVLEEWKARYDAIPNLLKNLAEKLIN